MNGLPLWLDLMVAALLLSGAVFALLGSLGLLRFKDFMQRLHGPTKVTTLGIGCIVLALIAVGLSRGDVSGRELLVCVFVLVTAPVNGMMLARANGASGTPVDRQDPPPPGTR